MEVNTYLETKINATLVRHTSFDGVYGLLTSKEYIMEENMV